MISTELKEQIMQIFSENLPLERCLVLLFGSEALSEATPRSDIDIGISCLDSIPDDVFLELQEKLNTEINTLRRIDLVELQTLDEDFLEFALKGAVIWHVGRDYLRNWIRRKERL